MRKYKKINGELPFTDFERGEIVVYEGQGEKDIIVLNSIHESPNGDIFYNTILVKAEGETPYLENHENLDFRNWFNGDTLRDATVEEVKELLDWILPFVPKKLFVDSRDYWNQVKGIRKERHQENITEEAYNTQTGNSCFTSTQMGILLQAVGDLIEQNPPAKTTIGEVVESIAGYSKVTVNQNMKGRHRESDIKKVVDAIESKFPKLAAKIRTL